MISNSLQDQIKSHLLSNSHEASNRVVKRGEDQYLPVRYLSENKIETWKSFPFKYFMSRSTFYNYLLKDKQYKKPFRLTDLCDYCLWAKYVKKEMNTICKSIEGYTDFSEPENLLKHFLALKRNLTCMDHKNEIQIYIETIQDYLIVLEHQDVARRQRDTYNRHRNDIDFLRKNVIIDVDYKQKIQHGMSPEQPNYEFYQMQFKCFLGKYKLV